MVCTGVVRGRRVELDGEVTLPEGTRVRVVPESGTAEGAASEAISLGEWLRRAHEGRARRPATSDSTELLRQIREERADR
jgi:hypothetical protein